MKIFRKFSSVFIKTKIQNASKFVNNFLKCQRFNRLTEMIIEMITPKKKFKNVRLFQVVITKIFAKVLL